MGLATPGICRRCRKAPRRPGGLICFDCHRSAVEQRAQMQRDYRKAPSDDDIVVRPEGGIMEAARLIERWQRE